MATVGSLLRDARESKELTLRSVEQSTGISNAYLSQIEGGKVRHPSPSMLNKLATLYGMSYATVMKAAGYPVPEASGGAEPSRPFARLGKLTTDEEEELAHYLEFLRRRRSRGRR